MTFNEAKEYLYNFGEFNIDLSLSRIKLLLHLLGNPHKNLTTVHVAGTNGKGSVCAMLSAILTAAGYRVGLYTSPHLAHIRERIRISEIPISIDEFAHEVELIKKTIHGAHQDQLVDLTFFEVFTALAFHFFSHSHTDIVILEVGLGGRLDATNVVSPTVTAITTIAEEHQEYLGETVEMIAAEKAGIIKRNTPLIMGNITNSAQKVILNIAENMEAPVLQVGKDITGSIIDKNINGCTIINARTSGAEYADLRLNLLGMHQLYNALTALGILDVLNKNNIPIPLKAVKLGISQVNWQGRLQVISQNPLVVLDGAHNPEAVSLLLHNIQELFTYKKVIMVMGFLKDKDVKQILPQVEKVASMIILVPVNAQERAFPPREVLKLSGNKRLYHLAETLQEGVATAWSHAQEDDLICIAGSLYLIGEFINMPESLKKVHAHN